MAQVTESRKECYYYFLVLYILKTFLEHTHTHILNATIYNSFGMIFWANLCNFHIEFLEALINEKNIATN